ncbi:hypothetical protein [Scatolibacter rhodanostii]|uniref:hypothetical protein n=1 Tax=Scatolibacter rhodanostii TaxID=2014781 RepID=UPI000C06B7D0|nr:hypothetical protein [Scatolibacter rhodanostii]
MVTTYQRTVFSMFTASCTVKVRKGRTNPVTEMEEFTENMIFENEPCRISFQSTSPSSDGDTPKIFQQVKLLISKDKEIPSGSKITVTQNRHTETYTRSGMPSIYSVHQEIPVELFKGWA